MPLFVKFGKRRIFKLLPNKLIQPTTYFHWIFVLCFDVCLHMLAKLIVISIHFTTDIKLSQLSKADVGTL